MAVPIYLKMTLPALRVRMDMNQDEAAKELGITRDTLRRWEKNPSKIPYGFMEKFSELYCIPMDYIFFDSNIAFSDKVKNTYDFRGGVLK